MTQQGQKYVSYVALTILLVTIALRSVASQGNQDGLVPAPIAAPTNGNQGWSLNKDAPAAAAMAPAAAPPAHDANDLQTRAQTAPVVQSAPAPLPASPSVVQTSPQPMAEVVDDAGSRSIDQVFPNGRQLQPQPQPAEPSVPATVKQKTKNPCSDPDIMKCFSLIAKQLNKTEKLLLLANNSMSKLHKEDPDELSAMPSASNPATNATTKTAPIQSAAAPSVPSNQPAATASAVPNQSVSPQTNDVQLQPVQPVAASPTVAPIAEKAAAPQPQSQPQLKQQQAPGAASEVEQNQPGSAPGAAVPISQRTVMENPTAIGPFMDGIDFQPFSPPPLRRRKRSSINNLRLLSKNYRDRKRKHKGIPFRFRRKNKAKKEEEEDDGKRILVASKVRGSDAKDKDSKEHHASTGDLMTNLMGLKTNQKPSQPISNASVKKNDPTIKATDDKVPRSAARRFLSTLQNSDFQNTDDKPATMAPDIQLLPPYYGSAKFAPSRFFLRYKRQADNMQQPGTIASGNSNPQFPNNQPVPNNGMNGNNEMGSSLANAPGQLQTTGTSGNVQPREQNQGNQFQAVPSQTQGGFNGAPGNGMTNGLVDGNNAMNGARINTVGVESQNGSFGGQGLVQQVPSANNGTNFELEEIKNLETAPEGLVLVVKSPGKSNLEIGQLVDGNLNPIASSDNVTLEQSTGNSSFGTGNMMNSNAAAAGNDRLMGGNVNNNPAGLASNGQMPGNQNAVGGISNGGGSSSSSNITTANAMNKNGMSGGMSNSLNKEVPDNMNNGVANGMTNGMSNGMNNEETPSTVMAGNNGLMGIVSTTASSNGMNNDQQQQQQQPQLQQTVQQQPQQTIQQQQQQQNPGVVPVSSPAVTVNTVPNDGTQNGVIVPAT